MCIKVPWKDNFKYTLTFSGAVTSVRYEPHWTTSPVRIDPHWTNWPLFFANGASLTKNGCIPFLWAEKIINFHIAMHSFHSWVFYQIFWVFWVNFFLLFFITICFSKFYAMSLSKHQKKFIHHSELTNVSLCIPKKRMQRGWYQRRRSRNPPDIRRI